MNPCLRPARTLAALFAGVLTLAPVAAAYAAPGGNDRATMALDPTEESLVFLGISGDYQGIAGRDRLQEKLSGELGLKLLGDPIRSYARKERMVWAVLTPKPDSLEKKVSRALKEDDFDVVRLRVSALALLDRSSSTSTVARAVRRAETREDRFWGADLHVREGLVWAFHESKLESKDVLMALRDNDLNVGFHHQEIELNAKEDADLAVLAANASAKLDLVRASEREKSLVLDLYFRDMDSFLALPHGRETYACPNVWPFLEEAGGKLKWNVTLDNHGYPFVD